MEQWKFQCFYVKLFHFPFSYQWCQLETFPKSTKNAKIKKSLWAITSNWIDSGKEIKALYQWCQLEMNKTDKNREDETMKVSILLCEISSLSFFISVMLTQIFQKSTKNTKMKKLAVGSYYKLDWEWKREKSVIAVMPTSNGKKNQLKLRGWKKKTLMLWWWQ